MLTYYQIKMNNHNKQEKENEIMRHSASHVMALAVQRLYPGVKFAIGPAIENGFYYDLELPKDSELQESDLDKIEKEIAKIIEEDQAFERSEVSIAEAQKVFKVQPYKQELLGDLAIKGEKKVCIYRNGEFVDLCKGPHVNKSSEIGVIKLMSIAGAYWKGDEKNQMLQRIYGVAFDSQDELEVYLDKQQQLKENDHRKLGQELDLFCFSELVGPGLPLYSPRGAALIDQLQNHIEKICYQYGFRKVISPHIAKERLYQLSGHAEKFSFVDENFLVSSARYKDFVMKPVQCPHQGQIYASRPRSYRDLPIRYMESNMQYRAEKPGELSGLKRVLAIRVEDGHSFCRVDQVKEEVKNMVRIVEEFYEPLGLWGEHWVRLSLRDYDHPENYIGEPSDWDKCEEMLQEVSDEMKLDAKRVEGEAALYGPKLDFIFKDAFGRDFQVPTIQLDFASPKRFDLFYIDEDGQKKPPVMVHRAILGSYERFLVLLIEHFKGNFPLWLAPEQVRILPINEDHLDYAVKIEHELYEEDIRVEIDKRSDALSSKIKSAQLMKIPYMVVIGDNEVKENCISVRSRAGKVQNGVEMEKFIEQLNKEIKEKK